jgi:hypothetical protein
MRAFKEGGKHDVNNKKAALLQLVSHIRVNPVLPSKEPPAPTQPASQGNNGSLELDTASQPDGAPQPDSAPQHDGASQQGSQPQEGDPLLLHTPAAIKSHRLLPLPGMPGSMQNLKSAANARARIPDAHARHLADVRNRRADAALSRDGVSTHMYTCTNTHIPCSPVADHVFLECFIIMRGCIGSVALFYGNLAVLCM